MLFPDFISTENTLTLFHVLITGLTKELWLTRSVSAAFDYKTEQLNFTHKRKPYKAALFPDFKKWKGDVTLKRCEERTDINEQTFQQACQDQRDNLILMVFTDYVLPTIICAIVKWEHRVIDSG